MMVVEEGGCIGRDEQGLEGGEKDRGGKNSTDKDISAEGMAMHALQERHGFPPAAVTVQVGLR